MQSSRTPYTCLSFNHLSAYGKNIAEVYKAGFKALKARPLADTPGGTALIKALSWPKVAFGKYTYGFLIFAAVILVAISMQIFRIEELDEIYALKNRGSACPLQRVFL